jgi:hypothetical protein
MTSHNPRSTLWIWINKQTALLSSYTETLGYFLLKTFFCNNQRLLNVIFHNSNKFLTHSSFYCFETTIVKQTDKLTKTKIQRVSWIMASLICLRRFDFRLEPILTTDTAASKIVAPFNSLSKVKSLK